MDLWIFDIDGVLAELQERLPELKKGNHRKFYMMIPQDTVIDNGAHLLKMVKENAHVVCATGRPEWTKEMTEEWMFKHLAMQPPKVYYRENGDYRPSPIIKIRQVAQILKDCGHFRHIYFVDDDPRNVKAVEEAFPSITGIIFTTWRLDEGRRRSGHDEGVGDNSISII